MEQYRGTTILSVRRGNRIALGGDGQVTLGNIVIKASARKVRTLYNGNILAGFAGGTADAFGPALIRRLSCETQIDAPAPLTGLDARPVRFGGCVDKAQMLHTVDEFLK